MYLIFINSTINRSYKLSSYKSCKASENLPHKTSRLYDVNRSIPRKPINSIRKKVAGYQHFKIHKQYIKYMNT